MATTMLTRSRAAFCANNWITKSVVAGVTLNNCSAATGSTVENLLVEDASKVLETTTPTADPQIIFQFSTPPAGRPMLGLVAHNVSQNYNRLIVAQAANIGGPWTDVGEVDLLASANVVLSQMNYDVFWELPTTPAAAYLRLIFDSGPSWAPLSIGQIFLMDKYELPVNPLAEGGHTIQRSRPPVSLRAMGGALHYARGSSKTDTQVSLSFGRISDAQTAQLYRIFESLGRNMVGYIPPGSTQEVNPLGSPHLVLRAVSMVDKGLPGLAAAAHVHDVDMLFAGGY